MRQVSDRFGVNITRFMKSYETELLRQLQALKLQEVRPQPAAQALRSEQPTQSMQSKQSLQSEQPDLQLMIARHEQIMRWLEHERLIHLIVMLLTALFLMFTIFLALFLDIGLFGKVLVALAIVLTAAYILHYARLENTIQRWHRISLELLEIANQQMANQQMTNQRNLREKHTFNNRRLDR